MFDAKSRYASLPVADYVDAHGETIRYVRRRFLPHGHEQPLLAEVTVQPADRLDLLTARTLGDPEQAWRVCDANDAMNPLELFDECEGTVRVALPQFPGES